MKFITIFFIITMIFLLIFEIKHSYIKIRKYILNKYKSGIKKISIYINEVISILSKINNKLLLKIDYKKEYESLTPKDDLDKNNSYIKALKESIDDLKRKNIAISGLYGSGKSSIIESFKKHYREYKYLDVSLATFISSGDDNLENELERNILNQIFYKVSYDRMPYSRFRKIKNIKFLDVLNVSIIYSLLIICISILVKPELIERFQVNTLKLEELFLEIPLLKYNSKLSLVIIVSISIITTMYVTMFLIRFILSKFTISTIQTKDGNLKIGKKEDETFNKYLDEIMYFFESVKYDVVFFEDLDRFDNLEIFTKLRELNNLINKSESINRKVTFIYAIKDEIFFIKDNLEKDCENKYIDKKDMNKNRTKFFDFIIPVIPIVNGENSYEILNNKVIEFNNEYGINENIINEQLVSDLAIFIDDMRLLTNIYNEFLIYYKRLVIERKNKTLNVNNLLAIIVYKNLYPVDFTKLQSRSGMVYKVFSEKNKIADKIVANLYREIEKYKFNIKNLEKEIAENETELYAIYNEQWNKMNIKYIRTNSIIYNIDQIKDINILEKIKKFDSIEWSSNGSYYWDNIKFEDFITINSTKPSFYDRLTAIKSKEGNIEEKIKYNQSQIKVKENQIKEFKNNSIQTLMKDREFFENLDEDIKKEPLIIRLLKYGYIDEMYSYYTLYFYEGRLKQKDFEFVQSVINNNPLEYNFKLKNINEILSKFRIEDFQSPAILNYDLIKFLSENLEREINDLRLNKTMMLLSELKEEYLNFLIECIYLFEEKSNFVEVLCKNINNFWNEIYNNDYITKEKKDYILEIILKYSSLEYILIQNNCGYIKKYIEINYDFIKTIASKIEESKIKNILLNLNVKLKDINQDIINDAKNQLNNNYKSILDYIYSSSLYEINHSIISKIIFANNIEIKDVKGIKLNYSTIKKSELKYLIEYIDNNINLYIKNIFMKSDIKENTDEIINILNNEDVDKELKISIIDKKEFKIRNINTLKDKELWELILNNLKLDFSWRNIIDYYKNLNSINECLAKFINKQCVYNELLNDNLEIDNLDDGYLENLDLFSKEFINSKIISDKVIEVLACKLDRTYSEFEFEDMLVERALILINKKIFLLNESMYKSLKLNYDSLHIKLLEINIEEFMNQKIKDLDSNDLLLILKSNEMSTYSKFEIVKNYYLDIEIDEILAETIFDVTERFLLNESLEYELIEKIIKCKFEKEKRRKLIGYQIKFIEKIDIKELLLYIDDEYTELLELSPKKMYIQNTESNMLILEELIKKEYISSIKVEGNRIVVNRKRT